MKALEWNPAFSPVSTALIVLGTGIFFYLLRRHLIERHGLLNTTLLLLPKVLVAGLLILALLDPDFKFSSSSASTTKVLILQDISSSMDLRDDGSSTRSERATHLIGQLESGAPANIHFQIIPFDTAPHTEGYTPKSGSNRGTDLAAALLALSNQPKFADADGAIIVSDGGDETVELSGVPSLPLAIVGIGTSPDGWNDIGIGAVTAPASVEEKGQFDLEADLYARPGTHTNVTGLKVSLEEGHDKTWTEVQSQTIDLSSLRAAVAFHVQVNGTGAQRYRVRLPQLPDELTYANNTRVVNVQVQQRALHVLYFTQELGVDYKYLRTELGADPGVAFTAMYRVLQDQFTVQGDRTGFQDLAQGFPTKDEVLKRYDCVILGSFAASQFSDAQAQTLVRYVQNGGALILLGGDSSFGRGGYAGSKLAPLMPWAISDNEAEMVTGSFPVTVSASAAAVDFTSGLREDLGTSGGAALNSLNQPGGLRPGAMALLDATVSDHTEPVVAWRHYGKGQVLGIASNTLWKWAAAGHETRALYGRFWRQAVRGLTRKLEGGSLLGVHWDKEHYRPGEQAVVEVHMRDSGDGGAGKTRLVGSISGPGGDRDVSLSPVMGQADLYTGKIILAERGDYTFRLAAYAGANLAESYERALPVEPLLEEGASPELKEAYLREIATRAGGGLRRRKRHRAGAGLFARAHRFAGGFRCGAAGEFLERLSTADHPASRGGVGAAAANESDMKSSAFSFLILLLACAGVACADGHPGTVEWSDGHQVVGAISLTSGKDLRVFVGDAQVSFQLGQVKEMIFTPEKEMLWEGFYFPNAGQATQMKTGEVYPIRYLHTQITLGNGQTVEGHLMTTVLYVETDDATEKVVIMAKQSGTNGEKLTDLLYPAAIRFAGGATSANSAVIDLTQAGWTGIQPPVILAQPDLTLLLVRQTEGKSIWTVPADDPGKIFLSVRAADGIHVAWPKATVNADTEQAVATGLKVMRDFYDSRASLGSFAGGDGTDIYSLVMMKRVGQSVDGNGTRISAGVTAWSLVLLRWKYDADQKKVTLLNRAMLAIGRIDGNSPEPKVFMEPELLRDISATK